MKFLKLGPLVRVTITSLFDNGAVILANYKLGELGIEGITVLGVDIPSGKILLDLEGEPRNIEVVIETLSYKKEETFTIVTDLSIIVRSEVTGTRKVWLEKLVNQYIDKVITEDGGIVISKSVKKMNTILDRVSFAKEA